MVYADGHYLRVEGYTPNLGILEENSVNRCLVCLGTNAADEVWEVDCYDERIVFVHTRNKIFWTPSRFVSDPSPSLWSEYLTLPKWSSFPMTANWRWHRDLIGDTFVFSKQHRCAAMNIGTGEEVWKIETKARICCLTGTETEVYFSADATAIERWDLRSCEMTARWPVPDSYVLRNLFWHDELLYISCFDWKKDGSRLKVWNGEEGKMDMRESSFSNIEDDIWGMSAGNNMLFTVDGDLVTMWK